MFWLRFSNLIISHRKRILIHHKQDKQDKMFGPNSEISSYQGVSENRALIVYCHPHDQELVGWIRVDYFKSYLAYLGPQGKVVGASASDFLQSHSHRPSIRAPIRLYLHTACRCHPVAAVNGKNKMALRLTETYHAY